jgi:hypothetical protein
MRDAPSVLTHFWAKLKEARLTSDGKVLELVDDTSFLGMENYGRVLMVRDCYKELAEQIESDFCCGEIGRVIVGSPGTVHEVVRLRKVVTHTDVMPPSWMMTGIGKSMFGYYLLYTWACCSDERVVFIKGNYLQESAFLLVSGGGAYELDHDQLTEELVNSKTR